MVKKQSLHEDLHRKQDIKVSSNRALGFVFAIFFTLIGLFPLIYSDGIHYWALVTAIIFLILGTLFPNYLKPVNYLWFKFGLLLHKIVNPLIMGFLFVTTVIPTALIMRMLGKDPLKRRFDRSIKSYWIKRQPPEITSEDMRNQF